MTKVLVIDDQPEVATAVTAALRHGGYEALLALDGRSGIELARSELPDLILCDVRMPEFDGYETLQALRADHLTAITPFIFLTGMTDQPHVRRGMDLGADDYLIKPFAVDELIAAVRTRLTRKEALDRQAEKKLEAVRSGLTLALPHELRTPLAGILGLSRSLLDEYERITRAELLEAAQDIHESALRLQRLIENFLAYAHLELLQHDKDSLRRRAAGLCTPTGCVVADTARRAATEAGREADLRCDAVSCAAAVIGEYLQKIVEELAGNAFKFSEPGSPVRVRTEAVDGQFTLTVTDCGRGMTAEQIARVGPHVQFDRRIHEQQGVGLGLIIAKRLTELQGGQWFVNSIPGRQTTVRVSFPLAAACPTAPPGKPG